MGFRVLGPGLAELGFGSKSSAEALRGSRMFEHTKTQARRPES